MLIKGCPSTVSSTAGPRGILIAYRVLAVRVSSVQVREGSAQPQAPPDQALSLGTTNYPDSKLVRTWGGGGAGGLGLWKTPQVVAVLSQCSEPMEIWSVRL